MKMRHCEKAKLKKTKFKSMMEIEKTKKLNKKRL